MARPSSDLLSIFWFYCCSVCVRAEAISYVYTEEEVRGGLIIWMGPINKVMNGKS